MKLSGINNIYILTKFQKLFFDITGLYMVFVDTEGEFVTASRGSEKFCLNAASAGLGEKCDLCNSAACKKAFRTKKPMIYTCFAGLTEIVSPVIVGGQTVGAALAGQVRIPGSRFKLGNRSNPENKKLKKLFNSVPVIPLKKIRAVRDFLFTFVNYVIGTEARLLHFSGVKINSPQDSLIKKAMDYIEENHMRKIPLRKISRDLNISPYYFSHLFRRKTGVSFHSYLIDIRLRHSSQMLKDPSMPIKAISRRLGFSDEFHFGKTFKRKYRITPGNFRKNYFN